MRTLPPPLGVQVIKLDSNQGALGGVGVARVGNKRRSIHRHKAFSHNLYHLCGLQHLEFHFHDLKKAISIGKPALFFNFTNFVVW